MEDEPWYSKAWEWANSPLYDLHKWGTREGAGTFERGLETGLEDIGSGLTSPLMVGLTIATFGGNTVAGAGVGALRAIGISEEAAPIVVRGAKLLMDAGFTEQMIGGLVTQSPEFLDALKDGDTEMATRLGTNILATGYFLSKSAKSGIEDAQTLAKGIKKARTGVEPTTTDRLAEVSKISGEYDAYKSMASDDARAQMEKVRIC